MKPYEAKYVLLPKGWCSWAIYSLRSWMEVECGYILQKISIHHLLGLYFSTRIRECGDLNSYANQDKNISMLWTKLSQEGKISWGICMASRTNEAKDKETKPETLSTCFLPKIFKWMNMIVISVFLQEFFAGSVKKFYINQSTYQALKAAYCKDKPSNQKSRECCHPYKERPTSH